MGQSERHTFAYTCPRCGHTFKRRQVRGLITRCPKCTKHVEGPTAQEEGEARAKELEARRKRRQKSEATVNPDALPGAKREVPPAPKLEEGKSTSIGAGPETQEEVKEELEVPKEKHAGILF